MEKFVFEVSRKGMGRLDNVLSFSPVKEFRGTEDDCRKEAEKWAKKIES